MVDRNMKKNSALPFFKAGHKRFPYHKWSFRFEKLKVETEYQVYQYNNTIKDIQRFYMVSFLLILIVSIPQAFLTKDKEITFVIVPIFGAAFPIGLAVLFSFTSYFEKVVNLVTFILYLLVAGLGIITYSVLGCNGVTDFEILTGLLLCFLAVAMFSNINFLSGSLATGILWICYCGAVISSSHNVKTCSNDTSMVAISLATGKVRQDFECVSNSVGFGWFEILRRMIFAFLGAAVSCFSLYQSEKFRRQLYLNFMEAQNWRIDAHELNIREGKKLGEGKFGEIFRCLWRGDYVAVKYLKNLNHRKLVKRKSSISQSPFAFLLGRKRHDDPLERALKGFSDEIDVMCALRHPNVVQFMGASLARPNLCLVMEYMSNGTLFDILHDQNLPLTWQSKIAFATDAAKGMRFLHLHDPPLFHCDLKSLNLLVDENWRVKVGDFGLLTFKDMADDTNNDGALGTLLWTAAELFLGFPYTEKCDVYSFGIVLWEISIRSIPYVKEAEKLKDSKLFSKISRGYRPRIPAWCPGRLSILITTCFHQDTSLRPSFSAIVEELGSMDGIQWDSQGPIYRSEKENSHPYYRDFDVLGRSFPHLSGGMNGISISSSFNKAVHKFAPSDPTALLRYSRSFTAIDMRKFCTNNNMLNSYESQKQTTKDLSSLTVFTSRNKVRPMKTRSIERENIQSCYSSSTHNNGNDERLTNDVSSNCVAIALPKDDTDTTSRTFQSFKNGLKQIFS